MNTTASKNNQLRRRFIAYLRTDHMTELSIFGLLSSRSLIWQLRLCKQIAMTLGLEIVDICVDIGVPGTHRNRPGLNQLFKHLRDERTIGVVAAEPSWIGDDSVLDGIEAEIIGTRRTLIYADDSHLERDPLLERFERFERNFFA